MQQREAISLSLMRLHDQGTYERRREGLRLAVGRIMSAKALEDDH